MRVYPVDGHVLTLPRVGTLIAAPSATAKHRTLQLGGRDLTKGMCHYSSSTVACIELVQCSTLFLVFETINNGTGVTLRIDSFFIEGATCINDSLFIGQCFRVHGLLCRIFPKKLFFVYGRMEFVNKINSIDYQGYQYK